MARYTDIDKLIAEYDRVHIGPAGGARKLMVEAPIADVAPRAEVAREVLDAFEEILCGEFLTERFWFELGRLRIKYMEGQK